MPRYIDTLIDADKNLTSPFANAGRKLFTIEVLQKIQKEHEQNSRQQ